MLQHDLLFEWRNVWQNVTLGLEIAHKDTVKNLERVHRMLSDYGLLEFQHKKPSQLSGGMRQRAALIRTMALEPDILLLDEPFSALDYQTRLTVSADIAAMIRKAEKSVILITHDLAEAISLADRVLILSARPARVKAEFPIHLTAADHSPLAARRAPEYGQLFNQIWEELSNENN
jgi:NitT/TauT family transport system ATP-binding protein